MKKTLQVVMLPTNEKANLCLSERGNLQFLKDNASLNSNNHFKGIYQYLYFLSDEEIKEGDWVKHGLLDLIYQVNKDNYKASIHNKSKKIIATTDTFLRLTEIVKEDDSTEFPYITSLPQPSQSFIEYFVKEYNKGNVITEVEVEYEEPYSELVGSKIGSNIGHFTLTEENKYRLKINPDHTINILPKKDSWSREEITPLIDFLKEIADDNLDRVSPGIQMRAMTYLASFEKNL